MTPTLRKLADQLQLLREEALMALEKTTDAVTRAALKRVEHHLTDAICSADEYNYCAVCGEATRASCPWCGLVACANHQFDAHFPDLDMDEATYGKWACPKKPEPPFVGPSEVGDDIAF